MAIDEAAVMADAIQAAAKLSGITPQQGRSFLHTLRVCLAEARARHMREARGPKVAAAETKRKLDLERATRSGSDY